MRQRTDEKRQEILDVATKLFLRDGYEIVSMSQIAEAVGGSKSTLYGYFSNKEDLFFAVVSAGIERMAEQVRMEIKPLLPLKERLRSFSLRYLQNALDDEAIALRRTVLSIAHKSDEGQKVYVQVLKSAWTSIVAVFEEAMSEGTMRKADPLKAAMQLKSLLENDMVERRLMCIDKKLSAAFLEKHVDDALSVFLGHYLLPEEE